MTAESIATGRLGKEKSSVRIPKPLIGTAVGAGALGATLALGLTMASASTGSSSPARAAQTSATTSSSARPSAKSPSQATRTRHNCPHSSSTSG